MDKKINFLCLLIIFLSLVLNWSFSRSLNQGKYLGLKTEEIKPVSGGIIPHHLLASHLIADFFSRLSIQDPKKIILLGPNHNEKGNSKVLTSMSDWKTDFGNLRINKESAQKIVELDLVGIDEEVLLEEHSISGIVPFIKESLPEASFLPLILSVHMSQKEIEFLARNLSDIIDKETVVVVAVDFSHGLKIEDAYKNDLETLKFIGDFSFPRLLSLGNDYLDSPSSVVLLLAMMKNLDKTNYEVFSHTSSAELMGNNFAETTSYFSIAFY
jgi:AmmeMemoRadiSam system protein B